MSHSKVRTRIAPSPTGPLHIGTARSALFNFVYARKCGGAFILRIEDTDVERSEARYEDEVKAALEWLGLTWDEFYRQSERTDLYEQRLRKLEGDGAIYWCPHTMEELGAERAHQSEAKAPPIHQCEFRDSGKPVKGAGVLRFKNNREGEIVFRDAIRGEIRTRSDSIGDFSVAKDFRTPLYNFAVVIDDADMKISHVIRGEDHISNTPKQLLLQSALEFEPPAYAHLPLVLGPDRSKLSKRHGPTSLLEYREQGYLPEALINFMALLGWHPPGDTDVFALDDLIRDFGLERVGKAGAIFDIEKLNWLNREYIRRRAPEKLAQDLTFFASQWADAIDADSERWERVVALVRERLTTLASISDAARWAWEIPDYDPELLRWKGEEERADVYRHLTAVREKLSALDDWNSSSIEAALRPYAEAEGRGAVLWPLRVALSGEKNSPGPFELAYVLGKRETLERIDHAIIHSS
ncbi:MAG: glutamate--tRNA ligase [Candidatus Niyogibacteria bacterium]|nr:glutamate--tRNA ligase [Candidatus Niyogibacteria bacterium]